jgi:hypothetical protein
MVGVGELISYTVSKYESFATFPFSSLAVTEMV